MKWKKFYESISNNPRGVHFNDMVGFLKHLGFIPALSGGSHFIFKHKIIKGRINIQDRDGFVPAYQVRQILLILDKHRIF